MNNTVILATILCSLSVDLSAQVAPENKSQSAKFDIVDKNTSMSLTVDMKHIPILLVYDNHIVEMEDTLLLSVERKQYTAEQLARVIGVKPSKIKACRYLKGEGATSIWGTRGFNGVLEVVSPSMYRKLKRKDKDVNFEVLNHGDKIETRDR